MDKTAIKNFAIWARKKLIADITYKAGLLGITEKEIKEQLPQSTATVQFFDIGTKEPSSITGIKIEQRKKLVEEIQRKANQSDYSTAYKNVIEEVAYTWFNRLIAIRFMEVNEYLPTNIRVLSSESSKKIEPDLVTHAMESNLDYSAYEKDRIVQLKHENKLDELFRMLFIKQCNALNSNLPELFEKTSDYTELLLNVSFTDKEGVVYKLVNDISEDDFNVSKEGQVEIIGWLYQYYNTEPKDETFALLKKNVKITKERIPSATQLFTPDWIVRYMVENSLGHLWLEGHPNDELKSNWKYYLDEAEQEDEVQKQLTVIREEYKTIKPEDIKVIDPAMGSGHILVYAFDVLMQIYESYGYNKGDAAKSIVENNLYGLDIDNRAYQLAYFAVMMKARQYNPKILSIETSCHLCAIEESNDINRDQLKYFGAELCDEDKNKAILQIEELLDTFMDAKEYGSIISVENYEWEMLHEFVDHVSINEQVSIDTIGVEDTKQKLKILIKIGELLARKYHVVVTNPPYMGSSGMSGKLSVYVKKNYPDSKSDLFAVFIEKCAQLTKYHYYTAMITQHSWMFLSGFERLRNIIIKGNVVNLIHLGARAFDEIGGEVVQTTSWIRREIEFFNYKATYVRLVEFNNQKSKELAYLSGDYRHIALNEKFSKMPGSPIAYWVSNIFVDNFNNGINIDKISDFTGSQNITANNEKYISYFWEVNMSDIGMNCNWCFYAKGGEFRKWYGNIELIIDTSDRAINFYKENPTSNFLNKKYWFQEGITYSAVTTKGASFRYYPAIGGFDKGGPTICYLKDLYYILGLLNSKVATVTLKVINPTINLQVKDIKSMPILIDCKYKEAVGSIAKENLVISKYDWDCFENSWDFIYHPLVKDNVLLSDAFLKWEQTCINQFNKLKLNEEELNRIFIEIYGLQEELTAEVEAKDLSIRKAEIKRDIRSFISYSVGCMFGRYSLDVEGLIYAGGEWDESKYSSFIPDKDNILPITDEEYFQDDIAGLFISFVKKVYGAETLEENLDFIAKALGNKGDSSREVIRNYFVKDFFSDHCKVYKKRPIYWLFDSGKENGFKALVYMHRYDENTIGNMRIDYLHKMQQVYENEINRMQETIDNSSDGREIASSQKRKDKLIKQLKETKEYDEKIAHLALARIPIDLDDGVKVNYEKVQTDTEGNKLEVLAKI